MLLRSMNCRIIVICALALFFGDFKECKFIYPIVHAIVDIEEPNDESPPIPKKRTQPKLVPVSPTPRTPEKQAPQANNRWLAIFSPVQGWNNQSVHTRYNSERMGQIIRLQCWDQGKDIVRAANGMGGWHLVCVSRTGYQQQKWFKGSDLDKVAQAIYDESFLLIDLSFGDGEWLGLGAKGTGWQKQSVESCKDIEELTAVTRKYWDKGYRITHLAYGQGLWVAVFSDNIAWGQRYEIAEGIEGFRSAFKKLWDNSYQVTSIAYGNERWLVVGSKSQAVGPQEWVTDPNWLNLTKIIQERWNNGRFLTHLIYVQ